MFTRTTVIPFLSAVFVVAAGFSNPAHAVLQGRDLNGSTGSFEAYYDTDLNITWLADANVIGGAATWATANTWAANLSIVDAVNNITYDNWRLPTINPVNGVSFNYTNSYNGSTDIGYNVSEQGTAYAGSTGSEMAHLFYNTLNNKGYCDPALSTAGNCSGPQAGWGLTNTGPFTNIRADQAYWFGTEYAPSVGYVWRFKMGDGYQGATTDYQHNYAWAVSSGDIGIASVPEPRAWGLMLSGLALVGAAARRRLVGA